MNKKFFCVRGHKIYVPYAPVFVLPTGCSPPGSGCFGIDFLFKIFLSSKSFNFRNPTFFLE